MGRKKIIEMEPEDPTGWMLDNGFAEFVLMHTDEIVSILTVTYVRYLKCSVLSYFIFHCFHRNTW